jgi:hypothetical protein
MENPLKPPLQIVELVVEVFLNFFPNLVTLKTSSKTSTTRRFHYSVPMKYLRMIAY